LKKPEINKKSFKRSFISAIARLIGVGLGAGMGSLLKPLVGDGLTGWSVAITMAIVSFLLLWFVEYERETAN